MIHSSYVFIQFIEDSTLSVWQWFHPELSYQNCLNAEQTSHLFYFATMFCKGTKHIDLEETHWSWRVIIISLNLDVVLLWKVHWFICWLRQHHGRTNWCGWGLSGRSGPDRLKSKLVELCFSIQKLSICRSVIVFNLITSNSVACLDGVNKDDAQLNSSMHSR